MKRLITLIVGVLCTAPWSVRAQFDDAAAAQLQKLVQAYRYVDAAYVDSLDTAPLVEEAIRGMLTRLDPHSAYLSEEEMKGVDESFDGSFGGIGIEFNVLNDTVVIVNTLCERASNGETVFYDIYTDEEKAEDPAKEDTGLFFFKGTPGEKFAICNAGGGFAYVGAMQDSFPHALELSRRGYNAFALIYRPGAQTACEDLARAIRFMFEHAEELEVNTDGYSLWGGSAGARMAAWLGSYGTEAFGEGNYPRPAAVVMQYTGHTDYTAGDPATFACVGEHDGIANWQTMQRRLSAMDALGIPTEFHHYPGLPHGFGLGTGTVAEGWLDRAVTFWEANAE